MRGNVEGGLSVVELSSLGRCLRVCLVVNILPYARFARQGCIDLKVFLFLLFARSFLL